MVSTEALVVVSCENYYEAQKLFQLWIRFCTQCEPGYILGINRHGLITDCTDVRYVFIDHDYEWIFKDHADAIVTQYEFIGLEGMENEDNW